MLEHPGEPSVLVFPPGKAVTIRWGRTISRKGSSLPGSRIPRDCTPNPIKTGMRQSELHGDVQSAAEMTAPVRQDADE